MRGAFAAAALAVTVLAVVILEPPRTLLYFSGKSELVSVVVTDPARGLIQLSRAFDIDGQQCRDGVSIAPAIGSVLHYQRPRGGDLLVQVEAKPGSQLILGTSRTRIDSDTLLRYRVSRNSDGCEFKGRVRLPAIGHLTVGRLYGVQPSPDEPLPLVLLTAKIQVYGRAISTLLGFPLTFAPFAPGALYPVQEFLVPGGSALGRALADERPSGLPAELTPWTGFVDLNDTDSDQALNVEATSNARTVELFLPSPPTDRGAGGSDADRVSLTLGARLLGDPNLRWLFGLATVLLIVVPALWSASGRVRIWRMRSFVAWLRRR